MKLFSKHLIGAAMISALTGCATEKIDLGNNTPAVRTGASLSDYAGGWTGYAEAFQFGGGSDVVEIELDNEGNGVIEVGEADEPLDIFASTEARVGLSMLPYANNLAPGFSYPIEGATVESARIRLSTSRFEVFREWCASLSPVLDELNSTPDAPFYSCVENTAFESSEEGCFKVDDQGMRADPIDCDLLGCQQACQCDAETCEVQVYEDVMLDAALENDGEELVGTLVLDSQRITVRMTRD